MRFNHCKFLFAIMLFAGGCSPREASNQPAVATQSPAAQSEAYPNLMVQAREVNDAFGRRDLARMADLTYPKLIETLGGRERMISSMTNEMKQMEAEGVVVLSSTAGAPTQVIQVDGSIYAVLPTVLKVKARDGIFQSDGSMIGISSDGGANWTFIDVGGKDQRQLKNLLPAAADKLQVPPEKPPVRLADGD